MTELSKIDTHHAVPANPIDLVSQALSSGANLETMERLLALQERWEANQARKAFNEAVTSAKGEIGPIFKRQTATGGARFQYESLDDVDRHIKPVLSKYGLSYRFRTESTAEGISVYCVLCHVDGHSEENSLYSKHDKGAGRNDIQALGSAQTYLQRYTLKAALGLSASKDDDGTKSGSTEDDQNDAENWIECMNQCNSVDELQAYFKTIWDDVKGKPAPIKNLVISAKDSAKKKLAGGQ